MDKRRLEAFVSLVEAGSFRQAAVELSMTQPALSQMIGRLESEIGVFLIDRSSRPIAVTKVGKEFYFGALRVLESMTELETIIDSSRTGHFGRVRVGVVPAMLFSSPARAVRSFRLANPEVEVELHGLVTSDLIEELDHGRLDVGILLTHPGFADVSSEVLYSEKYMVCLPSGHPLTRKDVVEFVDLKDERLIHGKRSVNPHGHDAVIAACASAGFSPDYESMSGSFLEHAAMVSAGSGVSFAPASFRHLQPNGVEYRELTTPTVGMTVAISWFDDRVDESARAFVRHCVEVCTGP